MDSDDITFYNKEIYLTGGMKLNFDQIVGNIGGTPRSSEFNKEVDVIIISDKIMGDLKDGIFDPIITEIESGLNAIKTPHRKLKFTSEKLFVEYLKMRAKGNIKRNQSDFESPDTNGELRIKIKQAIDEDERLVELLSPPKKKKLKEPVQQTLF